MKKAFTLIEVIISIFLFSLITVFLYKSISNLRLNNKNLMQNANQNKNLSKVIKLLKSDLILAKNISLKKIDKNYLLIETTLNSIHDISKPFVEWKILKNSKKLVRVEKNGENIFINDTTLKCKKIRIIKSNKNNTYLIYIKLENNQELITEVNSMGKII